MNKDAKKYLIFGLVLIILQILSSIGWFLTSKKIGISPIIILLIIIDFILFFQEVYKNRKRKNEIKRHGWTTVIIIFCITIISIAIVVAVTNTLNAFSNPQKSNSNKNDSNVNQYGNLSWDFRNSKEITIEEGVIDSYLYIFKHNVIVLSDKNDKSNDEYAYLIEQINNITEKNDVEELVNFLYIDLQNNKNKSIIGNKSYFLDIKNFEVSGPTLIVINNKEISQIYEGSDEILVFLKGWLLCLQKNYCN